MHGQAVRAYIAIGSNLGDRRGAIWSAIELLQGTEGVDVKAIGTIVETPALGDSQQPMFLNTVVEASSTLAARDLLNACLGIEQALGRHRSQQQRWAARTIDLDLVLFGDSIIDEPGLRVPHPEMHKRDFVLIPLAEIAPDVVHPVLRKSARHLLDSLMAAGAGIRRIQQCPSGD